MAVITAMANKMFFLSCISGQPIIMENNTRITRPIYPLNLSKKTVAMISLGFFVCAARSILRRKSPPMVEGRNKLKNVPPAKEVITLFKGKWTLNALSSISQRRRLNI